MGGNDLLRKSGVPAILLSGVTFFGSWGFFGKVPLPFYDDRAGTVTIEEVSPNKLVIVNEGPTLREFRVTLSASGARDAAIALSCCQRLPHRPPAGTPSTSSEMDFSFGDLASRLPTGESATIVVVPSGALPVRHWSIRVRADGVDVTDISTSAAHWLQRLARAICVFLVLYGAGLMWIARRQKRRIQRLCEDATKDEVVRGRLLWSFHNACQEWVRKHLSRTETAKAACVLRLAPARMLELGATGKYGLGELAQEAASWALRTEEEHTRLRP